MAWAQGKGGEGKKGKQRPLRPVLSFSSFGCRMKKEGKKPAGGDSVPNELRRGGRKGKRGKKKKKTPRRSGPVGI